MSQKIEKIKYCPVGYSSMDFAYTDLQNFFYEGKCCLCTKERFIQEFKTWSSGNSDIDKIIQESQINDMYVKLQWISYDNFQNIEHIADGGYGSLYSAKLKNVIKMNWNFIRHDWEHHLIRKKVAFKEINDSRYDIIKFLKIDQVRYFGISKNPSTQNYIIVRILFDNDFHNFLTKAFWGLNWLSKLDSLFSIAWSLRCLHEINLVHCNLHSGNILMMNDYNPCDSIEIDQSSCKLENDLILNANDKNNKIYGSIPYIPPEVLIGNEFTREGDIYSFGGIMYEIVAAQRPFADQAHDTYLMIDICNGVRPKVSEFMLWFPLVFRRAIFERERENKFREYIVDDDVMQQLQIADENQQNISKSQKQELFELFSYSSKLHPQSCYSGRYVHTLHGLHDLLEEIKSGKSPDPNLLMKSNESTTRVNSHNIGDE
ncbi:hypothetical protein Glove_230g81 [Diversispora epigaea]|uniref:Protein kinase domain-containing protein n=1 Tax=Diversispora epigaea TaxID=1348612 RepID=A0A397IHE6_9GLOM|nr:hypothetical protein Glove_230g81 [Diversispora epigaea]